MKFLSNAHTHTTYCDGQSTIAEQLAAATRLGFVSLGFSGHAMQGFDWPYCMAPEIQERYLAELTQLKAQYATQPGLPTIRIGLEQDALVPAAQKAENRRRFEYVIGSTHYFPQPLEDNWITVDGVPALLSRYIDLHFGGDPLEMAKAYYRMHGAYVEADRPDIIGHFDLVRKHAAYLGLDLASQAYREAALAALAQARRGCDVLEVNTGNIARGYDTAPYPAPFLLDAWRDMGGRLTLTSDCHNARDMDCAYDLALDWLREKGWTRILRLSTGIGLWDEIDL